MRPIRRSFWILAFVLLASSVYAGPGIPPGQKDRLKSLMTETRERTDRARGELMRARIELMQVYGSYQLDEKKARAARERIGKAQLDLLNLHLEDQLALRRVLNADQFQEFSKMMRQRFGGFHGPEGQGPEHFLERQALGEVDMDSDQKRRLRSVLGPEPGTMKVIERLRKDTEQLIGMYSRYGLDEGAARKLINGVHSSQKELGELNFKRQQQIRSVLTQAQFEKYRQAIDRRMRNRPWHKPPRRPR